MSKVTAHECCRQDYVIFLTRMRTKCPAGVKGQSPHNMSSPDSGAGGRTSREEGKVSRHLGLFYSHVYTYR